jgi:hypothetical protein
MPETKKYFSYLELVDGSKKYVKDAEAREDIARILDIIKNGSRYIGKFVSAVVGGETVNDLKEGDVPTSITTTKGTFVTGTPAEGQEALMVGDYTQIVRDGKSNIELMWNGQAIDEFGSTSMLKALAFKDSASGSFTPAGTNAASQVTFAEGAGSNFATGYNNDGVADTFQEGAFTPAEIQSGFVTPGVAPTYQEGAFNAGALASLTYDEANEGLVFAAGTLPSKVADTFSAGSPTAIDTTKFSGGSKAADTFVANTPTVIDTTKFSGGSKAADVFTPGSVPTLAVAKAITAADTAEAAAQVFTGTEGTVTVS